MANVEPNNLELDCMNSSPELDAKLLCVEFFLRAGRNAGCLHDTTNSVWVKRLLVMVSDARFVNGSESALRGTPPPRLLERRARARRSDFEYRAARELWRRTRQGQYLPSSVGVRVAAGEGKPDAYVPLDRLPGLDCSSRTSCAAPCKPPSKENALGLVVS